MNSSLRLSPLLALFPVLYALLMASPAAAQSRCTAQLVEMKTSPDSSCPVNAPSHWFPVGGAPADCHGWEGVDPTGRTHLNSASQMTCHPDGAFSFVQYAGNVNCQVSRASIPFAALGVFLLQCVLPCSEYPLTGLPILTGNRCPQDSCAQPVQAR